jgi:hypothetical protein
LALMRVSSSSSKDMMTPWQRQSPGIPPGTG